MRAEPNVREQSLLAQIGLGWITNLLIMGLMLVFMIIQSVLEKNNFRLLWRDPGFEGLRFLIAMVPCYALMPPFMYLVSGIRWRPLRWMAVVAAALALIVFLLHHLSHWYFGERPDLNSHLQDITLHLVGLWVLVNTIKWARLPFPERAREKTADRTSVGSETALQAR
jgi:hypothetical protein